MLNKLRFAVAVGMYAYAAVKAYRTYRAMKKVAHMVDRVLPLNRKIRVAVGS